MTIKNSILEQKWYYRVAKVIFSLLPLIVVLAFYSGYLKLGNLIPKNILTILQKNNNYIIYGVVVVILYYITIILIWRIFLYIAFGGLENDTIKKNSAEKTPANSTANVIPLIILLIVFAIFALVQSGYLKLPKLDMNPEQPIVVKKHTYGTSCTSNGKIGLYGTNGICYTCSVGSTAATSSNSNCSNGISGVYCCNSSNENGGSNKGNKCIPTGCGSLWRCSGSYYVGGKQISVNGLCFPSGLRPKDIYSSWTGTCRQCP